MNKNTILAVVLIGAAAYFLFFNKSTGVQGVNAIIPSSGTVPSNPIATAFSSLASNIAAAMNGTSSGTATALTSSGDYTGSITSATLAQDNSTNATLSSGQVAALNAYNANPSAANLAVVQSFNAGNNSAPNYPAATGASGTTGISSLESDTDYTNPLVGNPGAPSLSFLTSGSSLDAVSAPLGSSLEDGDSADFSFSVASGTDDLD